MTERLYYTDAYRTEFDARITDRADDGRRIYLDQSAFYPTSGGQPYDTGTIAGRRVVDVIDEEGRVAHLLDAPLAATLDAVHGTVDWTRRFDHMQQHTGQHLLSAVLEDLFGWPTVSVHFGETMSTLDVEATAVARDQIVAAEGRANTLITEARPIVVTFEDADTATGLRKPPPRSGRLRVVTIDGIDRSACGGTHVRTTAEIGPVLIRRLEKIRKTMRIEFVCGARAVRRARADFETLTRAGESLSTAIDDVPAAIATLAEQSKETASARRKLETELAGFRARARYDAATPDAAGRRLIVERAPSGAIDAWRAFALAVATLPKVVFIATSADPPSVMLASSEDSGVDAGARLREAVTRAGGRGGGSPRLAQGSVPDAAALDDVVGALASA